ncbi:MAG: hypothetical protein U0838_00085 [Chloroflexota bacterium]
MRTLSIQPCASSSSTISAQLNAGRRSWVVLWEPTQSSSAVCR